VGSRSMVRPVGAVTHMDGLPGKRGHAK
jgi:hypothetical protein